MESIQTFADFLAWASTPVGLAAIGGAFAVFLRDFEPFEKLSTQQKNAFLWLGCVIFIPLIFLYLPSFITPGTQAIIEPIFQMILKGLAVYAGNQATHQFWNKKVLKERGETAAAKALLAGDISGEPTYDPMRRVPLMPKN